METYMSYTDIVCVLMYADDDAHMLAQEWLDAMPGPTDNYVVFTSLMAA